MVSEVRTNPRSGRARASRTIPAWHVSPDCLREFYRERIGFLGRNSSFQTCPCVVRISRDDRVPRYARNFRKAGLQQKAPLARGFELADKTCLHVEGRAAS